MSTMWLLREVSIDWTINLTGDDHTIKFPSLHPLNFFIYAFSSNDSNHHLLLSHSIKMFLTSIYAPPPNHQYLYKPSPKSLSHLYRPPQINTTSLYPPHHFTYTWQSSHVPLFPQSLTRLYLQ